MGRNKTIALLFLLFIFFFFTTYSTNLLSFSDENLLDNNDIEKALIENNEENSDQGEANKPIKVQQRINDFLKYPTIVYLIIPFVLGNSVSLITRSFWNQDINVNCLSEGLMWTVFFVGTHFFIRKKLNNQRKSAIFIRSLAYSAIIFIACLWAQTLVLGGVNYLKGQTFGYSYALKSNRLDKTCHENSGCPEKSFTFLAVSDPQFFWNGAPQTNKDQSWSMSVIKNKKGERPLFATINGDLSSFGHPDEVQSTFEDFYSQSKIEIPIYFGLGNHDYENNIEHCWGPWWAVLTDKSNWCARYMRRIMRNYILQRKSIESFDEGGLAYSWNTHNIHFVQLQNYVEYETSEVDISSSEQWLMEDLQKAQNRNQIIIINQHIPTFEKLREILEEKNIKNVCMIFAGHFHSISGFFKQLSVNNDAKSTIPVYLSGSAEYNTMLLVDYRSFDKSFSISVINTEHGIPTSSEQSFVSCLND